LISFSPLSGERFKRFRIQAARDGEGGLDSKKPAPCSAGFILKFPKLVGLGVFLGLGGFLVGFVNEPSVDLSASGFVAVKKRRIAIDVE
jgi:hypothetical protein